MLGLVVLLALAIDRGVEVLLGSGVLDRDDPPLAGTPVNGRNLQALIGEPLQVEAGAGGAVRRPPRRDCLAGAIRGELRSLPETADAVPARRTVSPHLCPHSIPRSDLNLPLTCCFAEPPYGIEP